MKQLIDNLECKRIWYRNDQVQGIIRTTCGAKDVRVIIVMSCGLTIQFTVPRMFAINEFYDESPEAITVDNLSTCMK